MRVGMGLSREQEIEYAKARGIEIPVTKKSPYSVDDNLWGRSIETGVLEDPWQTPPADVYEWTVDPGAAPAIPTEIIIGFEGGVPVALDGEASRRSSWSSAERARRTAWRGSHRPRRGSARGHQEPRDLRGARGGHPARGPRGARGPDAVQGAAALQATRRATRSPRPPTTASGSRALHRDLREYVASSQRVVNGEVRLRLDHGNAVIVGRRSDDSLYDRALATYDEEDAFDHAGAVGFIRIFGLPLKTEAARTGPAWSWTEPLLGAAGRGPRCRGCASRRRRLTAGEGLGRALQRGAGSGRRRVRALDRGRCRAGAR